MEGKIVVFSGYAGTGKNTIINALMEYDKNLVYIPSITTREPRNGEEEGQPYYFKGKEDFECLVEEGKFIEYEEVHGNYYGTLEDKYNNSLKVGKVVLKDIDVKGAVEFKRRFGDNVYMIFVKPSRDEEVINRMRNRGDSEEDIKKRKKRMELEKSYIKYFDELLINDVLGSAVEQGREIIERIKNE